MSIITYNPEDFDVELPYNETLAESGRWFEIEDESGRYHGSYRLKYVDEISTRSKNELKRIRQTYAAEIRSKKLDEWDSLRVVLCEASLCDWRDIKMKGADVPYSKEAAMAYFKNEKTRWQLLKLSKIAGDETKFTDAAAEFDETGEPVEVETPEKN